MDRMGARVHAHKVKGGGFIVSIVYRGLIWYESGFYR